MRLRAALITALALTAPGLAAENAVSPALVLDRPAHVGEHSTITASCHSHQHRSIQIEAREPMVQDIDYSILFAGEREVLAVGAQGQPTRCRLHVTRCERTVTGQAALVMVDAGTQLMLDARSGQAVFSDAQGKEFIEQVQQALRLVLDRTDEGEPQDQALGSAHGHAAGERWAINPVPAARLLAGLRLVVDAEHLSGSAGYRLAEGAGAPAALDFATNLAFSAFTVAALSPGLKVTTSSGTLAIERRYPADPALPLILERRTLTESLQAQGTSSATGNEHAMAIAMELTQSNELSIAAPGATSTPSP